MSGHDGLQEFCPILLPFGMSASGSQVDPVSVISALLFTSILILPVAISWASVKSTSPLAPLVVIKISPSTSILESARLIPPLPLISRVMFSVELMFCPAKLSSFCPPFPFFVRSLSVYVDSPSSYTPSPSASFQATASPGAPKSVATEIDADEVSVSVKYALVAATVAPATTAEPINNTTASTAVVAFLLTSVHPRCHVLPVLHSSRSDTAPTTQRPAAPPPGRRRARRAPVAYPRTRRRSRRTGRGTRLYR